MKNNTALHLPKIDIMRAIAIMVVFMVHAFNCLVPNYEINTYGANHLLDVSSAKSIFLNLNPFAFGWSSIHLFLLISGFGIHLGYLRNPESFSIRSFFSKRFWRVYPPYLLILIFMCVFRRGIVYYFFTKEGMIDFTSHLFLVNNLSDSTFFTINGTFWCIAAEVQLYLLYPLFRYSLKKTGVSKTFLWILGISVLGQVIGIFTDNFGTEHAFDWSVIKFWFVWAGGALLAEKYHHNKSIFNNLGGMYSILFLILLTVSKYFSYTQYFQTYLATFMWLAFFEWFINTGKIKGTGLFSKIAITIGLCSYSIYLLHLPYLRQLLPLFSINPYPDHTGIVRYMNMIIEPLVAFGVIFLISYTLYVFVEQKSISIGRERRKKGKF